LQFRKPRFRTTQIWLFEKQTNLLVVHNRQHYL